MKKSMIIAMALISFSAKADEVYFSPHGGCESHIVERIEKSKTSIDVAMYSFNDRAIISELEKVRSRGVKVRVLLDRTQAHGNGPESLELRSSGIETRIHSRNKIQHNKFSIFDGVEIETGSFNWTEAAQNKNDENCLFLSSPKIIGAYQEEFKKLWQENTQEKSDINFLKIGREKK